MVTQRNVGYEVKEVWRCRKCQAVVQEGLGSSFSDADALVLQDLSSIGGWLKDVATQGIKTEKLSEDYIFGHKWKVEVDAPWECHLEYDPKRFSYVDVTLIATTGESESSLVGGILEKLADACASHGIQPTLSQLQRNGKSHTKYGVLHSLKVQTVMSGKVMRPILDRLIKAMRDALKAIG